MCPRVPSAPLPAPACCVLGWTAHPGAHVPIPDAFHLVSARYGDQSKPEAFFFWLCWVFVSAQGLSLVAASGGHSSSRCAGLSLSWPLLLWSTGSRRAGSVVVAHGPSCSAACGIFPDQGSNPCPLHRQADSQPLHHEGSPNLKHFCQFPAKGCRPRVSEFRAACDDWKPLPGKGPTRHTPQVTPTSSDHPR